MKGNVTAKAQLGFTPEPTSSYTVPIFHPPLLSSVLAPGWATHAKGKIAKKIKLSKMNFRKEGKQNNNACSDVNTNITWIVYCHIKIYKNRII